jgi:hypothetical protein
MQRSRSFLPFIALLLTALVSASAFGQSGQPSKSSNHDHGQSTYAWRNVKIVAGGFITGIIPHPTFPGVMFVRTDIGGAYRRDPLFRKWMPLTDFFSTNDWDLTGTESIAIDPVEPWRMYLAQGTYIQSWAPTGAILRSSDFGFSFQRTNLPIKLGANEQGRYSGERLAVDPQQHNIIYFGSRQNGLWKSTDFGATWNQVVTFPVIGPTNSVGVIFITFKQTSSSPKKETIYVGVSDPTNGLYSSVDSGATWQSVAGQPTQGFLPNHYALSPDGTLYITYGDGTGADGMGGPRVGNGAVWKYNTATGTWTDITPAGPWGTKSLWYGFGAATVDAQHPSTVMVTTLDRWWPGDEVYRSLDAGATWLPLGSEPAGSEPGTIFNFSVRDDSLSPYLTGLSNSSGCTSTSCDPTLASFGWWLGTVAIDPFDSNHALYGTGATIWETHDLTNADSKQLVHWTVGANGIEETAVLSLLSPPAGAHLLSGVGDIDGFRHDDLHVSPPQGMIQPHISAISMDFAQNNPSYIARIGWSNPEGEWSSDGGVNWTGFSNAPSGGPRTIAVSADGSRLVLAPNSGTPAWSTDNGTTWTASTGVPASDPVVADRFNALKFYAFDSGTGSVYVSVDGGVSFTIGATGLPNNGSIHASPAAEGDVWIGTNSGFFHSTNSGASFASLPGGQQVYAFGFGKGASSATIPALYLTGVVNNVPGIYRSTDAGATWVRINDDDHQYAAFGPIIGDPRIFGRVYVGTNGRGVVYGDIASEE